MTRGRSRNRYEQTVDLKTEEAVLRALRSIGVTLSKVPGFASWTSDCFQCGLVDGLKVSRTATEADLYPVKLWCTSCRNIPIADIPAGRRSSGEVNVRVREVQASSSGNHEHSEHVHESPDGRALLRVMRLPRSSLQQVVLHFDGALIASDSFAVMKAPARGKFARTLPEEVQQWATQVLLESADRISKAAEPAIEKREAKGGTIIREDDPYPEPVAPADVLDLVKHQVEQHIALPEYGAVVLTLWIALTYFIGALSHTPYLLISSPVKGCGKTLVLELLELLVSRPLRAGNMTGAALFRGIEIFRPTLLLDEIDTMNGPRLDDVTGVLNDGFHPAGKVVRCVGDDFELKSFSVYCAKALAGIGRVLKSATRSRCISLPMHRASPVVLSRLKKLRTDKAVVWSVPLASKLARLGEDFTTAVRHALQNDEVELPPGIDGRDAQLWEGMIAVADLCGESWGVEARAACVALTGLRDSEDVGDAKTRLLCDVRDFFTESGREYVSSAELTKWLVQDETRGWGEVQGRELSAIRLASMLKPFDVAPRVRRVDAGGTKRLWSRAEFVSAWSRYLPPATTSRDSETAGREPVLSKPATPETGVTPGLSSVPSIPEKRTVGRSVKGSSKSNVTGVTPVTGSENSVRRRESDSDHALTSRVSAAVAGVQIETGEVVYGFPD